MRWKLPGLDGDPVAVLPGQEHSARSSTLETDWSWSSIVRFARSTMMICSGKSPFGAAAFPYQLASAGSAAA